MSDHVSVVCPACLAANRVPPGRLHERPACGRCHEKLFVGEPVDVDEAGFERFLARTGTPLLADFWAPWCGPCLQMAPAFADAARTLEPRARFVKVDIERAPSLAARFAIRGVPTLVLFDEGRELGRRAGAMSAPQIRDWLGQSVPVTL